MKKMKQTYSSPLLEKAILTLPYQTQKSFRIALKPHLLTSETFISTKYNKKKIELKNNHNIMRNKFIDFQNNFKQKKQLIKQLSKETEIFSKGYKGLSIENNVLKTIKRDKILYNDLIQKYKEQGYDTNILLSNNNLFKKSLFLERNENYKNILNYLGNKKGNQFEKYLDKVDSLIKGTHKIYNINSQTTIKLKENNDEDEDNFIMTSFDYNQRIKNLKNEIELTKRTIDDMNYNYDYDNPMKTMSLLSRNFSDYQNIISSSRSSHIDNLTKTKFNSTQETNFTFHKKNNSLNKNQLNNNAFNLISNYVNDNKKNENNEEKSYEDKNDEDKKEENIIENDIKTIKNDIEINNNINNILNKSQSNFNKKSRNHKSMMLINDSHTINFPSNTFRRQSVMEKAKDINYKDIDSRMNIKIKAILNEQKKKDIKILYEKIKTKTFDKSENEIINYFKKYKKSIIEKAKYNIYIIKKFFLK